MPDNMKLWDAVEKTNPAHTKPAKIGGMSITAIAPQAQIKNATEQFGPYGKGWGFKKIDLDFSLAESLKLIIFKGVFFFPGGEFEIINSNKLFMDRAQQMVDADFAKKIETDALTKALSKLGFNADVFMGRFDDNRYVQEMTNEFAPVDPDIERIKSAVVSNDAAWIKENWAGVISAKWAQLGTELQNKLQGK